MTHEMLKFGHVLGYTLMGAGLIGVFLADARSRQVDDLGRFAECVRAIAVFYDGLVVPGAVLLLLSGSALIWLFDVAVTDTPWLLGMILLFAAEFVEGNTITRLYFRRLLKKTRRALADGASLPELEEERGPPLATFTHFLDLPAFLLIVSLGVFRPDTWTHFLVGAVVALLAGTALSVGLPRLYPWPSLRPKDNVAKSTGD